MEHPFTKKYFDGLQAGDKLLQVSKDGLTFRLHPINKLKPDISKKSWCFRFRSPINGKTKLFKIGNYEDVTITHARNIVKKLKAQLADGHDPILEKKVVGLTLVEAFEKYFARASTKTKRSTLNNYKSVFYKYAGQLKSIPYKKLSRNMIKDHARANIESYSRKKIFYSVIVNTMAFCESEFGDIEKQNFTGLLALENEPPKPDLDFVTVDRLPQFISDIHSCKKSIEKKYATLLLLMWGCRVQSLLNLQWKDIGFDNNKVSIFESKTSTNIDVFLTEYAKSLLEKIKPVGAENDHYVFHLRNNRNKPNHRQFVGVVFASIKEKSTAHRLRYTFSSILNDAGFNPMYIEICLGHAVNTQISRIYNKSEYQEQRKPLYQYMSDLVENEGDIEAVSGVNSESAGSRWRLKG
ncbi:tyrosine-type recombinase/integrase [Vibrio algicola]|uniref:Tyrosine-type recombinase/integrase n=1 Tax=Vibrio algicola TaxID=2662262 RepID=A0A5Q0TIN4_9VIBR|nr:tyrosine-type recombinase/integrase [Vibrio algicola]